MTDPTEKLPNDEYDTPWKEILEAYFEDFIHFFLPVAYEAIDWQQGYEFLDKELARITREAQTGDRCMDKLVKVWQKDGQERCVLIHIEIQADRKPNFQERMYTYQFRSFDQKQMPVVGLAILADEENDWRPDHYQFELWGTQVVYRFNMVKLMDYLESSATLEASNNPFAMVTLAHLQAKKTKGKIEERYHAKMQLIRNLYQRGFSRQQLIDLFRFIDWVLHLPEESDNRFMAELLQFEENTKMPYITSVERIGIKKGKLEGKQEMLSDLLRYRFGSVPDWAQAKLAESNLNTLENWSLRIFKAEKIESIFEEE